MFFALFRTSINLFVNMHICRKTMSTIIANSQMTCTCFTLLFVAVPRKACFSESCLKKKLFNEIDFFLYQALCVSIVRE